MIHDVSLGSISNSSSECLSERCSRHHHWETNKLNFSDQCQTKVPSSEVTKMNSTIFSRFLRALRRRQLKQNIWKMVWFSMSLYKFKSSLCSPCNQSTQRRRQVYCCWVSSSPIKRAEHETCKYDVNHHGWSHHQGEKTNSLLPMQKRPNGFISPQMSDISSQMSYFHR